MLYTYLFYLKNIRRISMIYEQVLHEKQRLEKEIAAIDEKLKKW